MDRVTAFENTLALSITDRRTDGITAELAIRPGLLNTQGVLHGGIIATLADEAAWHALGNHFGRAGRAIDDGGAEGQLPAPDHR